MTTGYKTVTPIQLGNLLHALKTGSIAWSGARVWFACLEMVAIREAARRSAPAPRNRSVPTPDFTLDEVVTRTGLAPRVTRRTVGRLERLGLLTVSKTAILFASDPLPEASSLIETIAGGRSPRRPIPIPRRLARHLASSPDATAGHVMLGYVLRGMSLERGTGEIRSAGTVKAGWLADTLGLGLRTVRSAQARLRSLGWIGKDTGSRQWKLNRDGAWFRIDPDWQAPKPDPCGWEGSDGAGDSFARRGVNEARADQRPVTSERRSYCGRRSSQHDRSNRMVPANISTEPAPLPVEIGTPAAPPKKDPKTPSESKNQKTHSGVWNGEQGKRSADGRPKRPQSTASITPSQRTQPKVRPHSTRPASERSVSSAVKTSSSPRITNIRPEDLHSPDRLHSLRRQAVTRGWIRDCEAETLNFFAAAVRARSTGAWDPVRVFVSLVRSRQWGYVTQAHENEARHMLQPRGSDRARPPLAPGRVGEVLGGLLSALNPHSGKTHVNPNWPRITPAQATTVASPAGAS